MVTLSRSEFSDREIAVLGMGRSGMAAAVALREAGARVLLSDAASPGDLGDRWQEARRLGVEALAGARPAEALAGAEIVVTSPGIAADSPVLRLAQALGLTIYSEIEVAYRIARAPIVAVTGTNGKSTVTVMIGDILREAGEKAWVAGNISADSLKMPLITAAMRADENDVIVAEVSSFQLEWVERFRCKVGVLTNITPDHLNRHSSFAEYVSCKGRLFEAQRETDTAVINSVNAPARKIGSRLGSRVLWFDRGYCGHSDWACVRDDMLTVRWRGEEYPICSTGELLVPGAHNVENALAAAGATLAFGVDPLSVGRALRKFRGVVHRMEPVAKIEGVLYINNSMCTNPDAGARSLEAMESGVILIAGGAAKRLDFSPFAAAIARHARHVVLTGRDVAQIEQALAAIGYDNITHAPDMDLAVGQAAALAVPGDVVMLAPACASHDRYANFEERGEHFRRAVRALNSGT